MVRTKIALILMFFLSCTPFSQSVQAESGASDVGSDAVAVAVEQTLPLSKPKVRRGRKVLIVGDSEACVVGSYIDLKKLVADINDKAQEPRDSVSVDCKGGTMIQYWGAGGNLRAALVRHPNPDAVLVFLGTNHYLQSTTPPTQTVTDLLKQTDCIWVGNTAVHGKRWKINSLIRDAVTPQCKYFDTEAADIPLADGVHPTPAGASKWIRLVWPLIPPKYEDSDE
jgi:hypothetical protein